MRILYLLHQYLPEFTGGTELYTQSLAATMVARGDETAIFYRTYVDTPGVHERVEGATTCYAAAAGPFDPTRRLLATFGDAAMHQAWAQVLDRFRPDIVHVNHLMGLPVSLLGELRARKIPYVVTLLDYWWVCANANLLTNYDQTACAGPQAYVNCTRCAVARNGSAVGWLAAPVLWPVLARRTMLLRAQLQDAAALLAPSQFVADWYATHGIAGSSLHTVLWGVAPPAGDLPSWHPEPGLRLLYVGGIAPNKGVHIVLRALANVRGAVRIDIAGDVTQHPDYVAELRQLADDRVRFLGRLDRPQVWQALATADVVVVPSLWHETFCLVAHEARLAGAPVLASRMGALQEAVRDDVDGLLLPPGDSAAWAAALQRLVDQPAVLAAWRRQVSPPLPFAEHVVQVAQLYAGVVDGRLPPSTGK